MPQLSVMRSENKYLLTHAEALSLQDRLDRLLKRDSYSREGAYLVRSLYLDSPGDVDFYDKLAGTKTRKKIRLRCYSPSDEKCKLEIKQKNGDSQQKISLIITKQEAYGIADGDFGVLEKYFDRYDSAAFIYTQLRLGVYRPKAMVEYNRIAFMHELFSTRITFDMNVRSSESCFDLFARDTACTPVFNDMVVLEVKYNGVLLDSISDILKSYDLSRTSISKYCISKRAYFDF